MSTKAPEQLPQPFAGRQEDNFWRQQLAQQMMQMSQGYNPYATAGRMVVKTNPLEFLVRGLGTYLGARQMRDARAESQQLGQDIAQARQQSMAGVMEKMRPQVQEVRDPQAILEKDFTQGDETIPSQQVTTPPDVQAAIARAMQSPWQNVQEYGQQLQRDQTSLQEKLMTALAPNNPQASVAVAREGVRAPLDLYSPEAPRVQMTPTGSPYIVTRNAKGEYEVKFEPRGTTVNVGAQKASEEFKKKLAESFVPGSGKAYLQAETAEKLIRSSSDALRALERGAQTGTGAQALQTLRGLGEMFGVKDYQTMPTGELSTILARRVLDQIGNLGVGVSNADRTFYETSSGDLSTNPAALKKILLDSMKYSMMALQKYNKQVDDLGQSLEDPLLSQIAKMQYQTGDIGPQNADVLEKLLTGQSVMPEAFGGISPPAPQASSLPPPPQGSRIRRSQ